MITSHAIFLFQFSVLHHIGPRLSPHLSCLHRWLCSKGQNASMICMCCSFLADSSSHQSHRSTGSKKLRATLHRDTLVQKLLGLIRSSSVLFYSRSTKVISDIAGTAGDNDVFWGENGKEEKKMRCFFCGQVEVVRGNSVQAVMILSVRPCSGRTYFAWE